MAYILLFVQIKTILVRLENFACMIQYYDICIKKRIKAIQYSHIDDTFQNNISLQHERQI